MTYAYAPWVDPPGTGNGAKKWTLIPACACEALRKSSVRCRTTSNGTAGQFGVVEPGATAGRLSPGGVSLKWTAGDVRSMSRMFIRARRGLGVGAGHPGHLNDGYSSVRWMWVIPGNSGVTTVCASTPVEPHRARPKATIKRAARLDIAPLSASTSPNGIS